MVVDVRLYVFMYSLYSGMCVCVERVSKVFCLPSGISVFYSISMSELCLNRYWVISRSRLNGSRVLDDLVDKGRVSIRDFWLEHVTCTLILSFVRRFVHAFLSICIDVCCVVFVVICLWMGG